MGAGCWAVGCGGVDLGVKLKLLGLLCEEPNEKVPVPVDVRVLGASVDNELVVTDGKAVALLGREKNLDADD